MPTLNEPSRSTMLVCDNPLPSPRGRLLKSRRAREYLGDIGNTKFWELVKQGRLRMVALGGGHRLVDGNSLADLIEGATATTGN